MVNRIRLLCKERGTTFSALEKTLGFANGSIAKTDEKTQSGRLLAIANYFDVSMEYLLTGAESPNEPLSASERELLRLFRELSPEGRTEATERIKEMTEATRWKKKEPHKLSESGIA